MLYECFIDAKDDEDAVVQTKDVVRLDDNVLR